MQIPLDPDVADTAPTDPALTPYDHEHLITYLRLLDADDEGVDWREVARIVLHLDETGVREPSKPREMDDGAWLPTDALRWHTRLIADPELRADAQFLDLPKSRGGD
jgi:hypothetical protein